MRRAVKRAVMWEALGREDHTPLDLLVTNKEEACTRLAHLPCTSKRDTEELLIDMLESLRVKCKMSCAQVKERVVKDSPGSKHEGRGDGS